MFLFFFHQNTQASIRRAIDAQPINDQRELLLGCDKDDNTYIHFPQFCGADLRIYRQSRLPEPVFEEEKRKSKVQNGFLVENKIF